MHQQQHKTVVAIELTNRGKIIHYSDGTRENIKTKENPKNILWQIKKRGINKKSM